MLHVIAGRHDMSWPELTKEGAGGIGEPAISLIMRRWPRIWQQNEQLALATHLTVFSLPQSNLHCHDARAPVSTCKKPVDEGHYCINILKFAVLSLV